MNNGQCKVELIDSMWNTESSINYFTGSELSKYPVKIRIERFDFSAKLNYQ
jgi:hypothetical protein